MKRDRLQLIYDILKAVQQKDGIIKPTHIMYKANLSHQMLDEYLKELIKVGFLEESVNKKNKTYKLTNKGYKYIDQYKVITGFVESFGLGLD